MGRMRSSWRHKDIDKSQRTDEDAPRTGSSLCKTTGGGTDENVSSDVRKESTRTFIAQLYVWAFFIVIIIVFIVGIVKSFSVDDYKDMLVTVSGVLSGPLGFIVGYYFKASKE